MALRTVDIEGDAIGPPLDGVVVELRAGRVGQCDDSGLVVSAGEGARDQVVLNGIGQVTEIFDIDLLPGDLDVIAIGEEGGYHPAAGTELDAPLEAAEREIVSAVNFGRRILLAATGHLGDLELE